jgi:hypothetical protein
VPDELALPEDSPLGFLNENYEVSKIESYNLADYVLECHHQGFRYSKIANLCNKKLSELKDGKDYRLINAQNVKTFLASSKAKEVTSSNITPYNQQAINVLAEAENILTTLKAEIEKLRDPEQGLSDLRSPTFIKLMKEEAKILELIANLQGKIQPQITFNIFQSNITKFCDRILACSQLTDEQKSLVITWATEDLLPPAPLKTVEGTTK